MVVGTSWVFLINGCACNQQTRSSSPPPPDVVGLDVPLVTDTDNPNTTKSALAVAADVSSLLSTYVVALCAEFNQYLHVPVLVLLVSLLQVWIIQFQLITAICGMKHDNLA